MKIFGIDSATEDKRIGYSIYDFDKNTFMEVSEIPDKTKAIVKDMKKYSEEQILLCFDAPLGWPEKFALNLYDHMAGDYINKPREDFFKRKTDIFCSKKIDHQLFDVSADKIAKTSFKTLDMINEIKKENLLIQLLWDNESFESGFIEVYPKSWLISNFPNKKDYENYKKNKEVREKLLKEMKKRNIFFNKEICKEAIKSDHVFDSMLCCLIGEKFMKKQCYSPKDYLKENENIQEDSLKKEGWIWFEKKC
ncbi:DUF429 domain-containing protein [Paenibacillus sp. An7]|uniref:DUF429 domain-containing protein n=1 Tax=Paenibacillus sp. An7 TaxID=2689577 RepID=UPI00135CE2B1|nr:DUF429 domain-containing protein [Paenibacillus sp. An7]